MAKLFANSGNPDQTPRSAASDLGLHCLPSTLILVSRLQWVKRKSIFQHAKNSQIQIILRMRKVSFAICSILIHVHSVVYNDSVNGQRRP